MAPTHKATYYLDRMRKKVLGSKQRVRRQDVSRHDRKLAAKLCELRKKAIWDDITEEWKRQEEVATSLAAKHDKKPAWMLVCIQRLPTYGAKRRKVNRWNAYIHAKSLDINEGEHTGI